MNSHELGNRVTAAKYVTFVTSSAVSVTVTAPLASLAAGLCAVYVATGLRFEWLPLLPGGMIARRLLRTAIYFLPLAAIGFPPLTGSPTGLAAAAVIAVALLVAQRHEIVLSLDRTVLALRPPLSRGHRTLNIGHTLAAAPAQEYLHRFCVIMALTPHIGIGSVAVGALTFHIDHAIQRKRFDSKDIIIHTIIGVSCGSLVYLDQGWLSAVLLHGLYNSTAALEQMLRPSLERAP